jgi:hypothetical protein
MTLKKSSLLLVATVIAAVVVYIALLHSASHEAAFSNMSLHVKIILVIWWLAFLNVWLWLIVSCFLGGRNIRKTR